MIKRRLIHIFLMTIIILMPKFIYAENIDPPVISAQAGILMDAKTGQVLYQKNMDEPLFPASITKIMTVLVGIENSNMDDTITMSHSAVFGIPRDSANIALDEGENINFKDALYAAMVASANEACNGIAEHVSGNVEDFSNLMNSRAKEAGAKHTNFVNANGLHDENHVTTAYDMAMITKAALKNNVFREIFETSKYEISPTNKQPETRYLWCAHKMLKETNLFYERAVGGKTGYTEEALNTLVTLAEFDGRELIVVLLKNPSGNNNYKDTLNLFEYGFSQFNEVHLTRDCIPDDFKSNLADEELSFLESNNFLLHKDLDISDVMVNTENYLCLDNQNIIKYKFYIDPSNKLMYSVISEPEHIDKNANTAAAVSDNNTANIKFYITLFFNYAVKTVLFLAVIMFLIYMYVNRIYYWKKLKRKINRNNRTSINNNRKRRH